MKILLLIASFLWGSNVLVMKALLPYVSRYALMSVRIICSTIVVGLFGLSRHRCFKLTWKQGVLLWGLSFLNITLNFLWTFKGLEEASGQTNALMNALGPALSFIMSLIFLQHHASMKKWMAFMVTILGFFVSIHFKIDTLTKGHFYLFLGLVSYHLSSVLIERWIDLESEITTFYLMLSGGISLSVYTWIKEGASLGPWLEIPVFLWVLFGVVSVLGFGLIQRCLIEGNHQLGVVSTSFILGLNPLFTFLLSWLVLHEVVDIYQWIALFLMILGLYLSSRKCES